MSSFTAKYQIPVLGAGDPVAMTPTVMAALANRVDLLLGESGTYSQTGTSGTQAVSLARTYPGDTGAAVPGWVLFQFRSTLASGVVIAHWITAWTGTATTITGFTINWQASNPQSDRTVHWRFLPVL